MNANTQLIAQLGDAFPGILGISSPEEYEAALMQIETLIEDYDNNTFIIDILSLQIERYEDDAPEFEEFNQACDQANNGLSLLKTLIDQHKLKTSDFQEEIGGKSMVSQVLGGKKQLTMNAIKLLSARFGVSPALFF